MNLRTSPVPSLCNATVHVAYGLAALQAVYVDGDLSLS